MLYVKIDPYDEIKALISEAVIAKVKCNVPYDVTNPTVPQLKFDCVHAAHPQSEAALNAPWHCGTTRWCVGVVQWAGLECQAPPTQPPFTHLLSLVLLLLFAIFGWERGSAMSQRQRCWCCVVSLVLLTTHLPSSSTSTTLPRTPSSTTRCVEEGYFKCRDSEECVPRDLVCNSIRDCLYGDDESSCGCKFACHLY